MSHLDDILASHPLPTWRPIAWVIIALLGGLITWANFTTLEEVSVVMGEVAPQGKVRVIQHLEGGIVEDIYVKEGDRVRVGSSLVRLNLATSGVNHDELVVRLDAQRLIKARLEAQAKGIPLTFPPDVVERRSNLVRAQKEAFEASKRELEATLRVLENQENQKELEVKELESKRKTLEDRKRETASSAGAIHQQVRQKELEVKELGSRRQAVVNNLRRAKERFKMSVSLLSSGLTPRMEHLQLEAEVENLEGEKRAIESSIPRARAAVAEVEGRLREEKERVEGELNNLIPAIPRARSAVEEMKNRIEEAASRFRREARDELSNVEQAISRIGALLKEATEQKGRAEIKSPIEGVVKNMGFNTIGGVVRPGDPIMEIVPTSENLVINAQLNPTDRGYVELGQKAVVKISTYDFVRYGSLDGEVIMVAPDSSTDPNGNPYFQVVVKTGKTYLGLMDGELPIIPGMQATVDIHTGEKSVIDYLVKPVLKIRHEAFRER
jgi:adhesin transport system membrane fusion protein